MGKVGASAAAQHMMRGLLLYADRIHITVSAFCVLHGVWTSW